MSSSTSKKVVIRRFDREPLAGFVNQGTYLRAEGVELLTQTGTVSVVPYTEIKSVCFVRDFDSSEGGQSGQLFHTRPKTEGLWVRMEFVDGDVMDGLLANNLLQLESSGFMVVPPSPTSNNQRIFIPKISLRDIRVVGVVGSPVVHRKKKPAREDQLEMFN
ncbi:MAG: hypothetical protein ABFD60_06045 [Bryobacteraceae bacterium]